MRKLSTKMKRMLAILLVEVILATNVITSYANQEDFTMTEEEAAEEAAEDGGSDSSDGEDSGSDDGDVSEDNQDSNDGGDSQDGDDAGNSEDNGDGDDTNAENNGGEGGETGENGSDATNSGDTTNADAANAIMPVDTTEGTSGTEGVVAEGGENGNGTTGETEGTESEAECTCTVLCTSETYSSECALCAKAETAEDKATYLTASCKGEAEEATDDKAAETETKEEIVDNSVKVTAVCRTEDGKEIQDVEELASFEISVGENETVTLADEAPEAEGYIFTGEVTYNNNEITQIKKEAVTETEEVTGEDGVSAVTTLKTISMSYTADTTWNELTGDITVVFTYAEEEAAEEETTVTVNVRYVDMEGNSIKGYDEEEITIDKSMDLTVAPTTINGYTYKTAMIDETEVSAINKNTETADDGKAEVVTYTYTVAKNGVNDVETDGDTELKEGTTISYVYEEVEAEADFDVAVKVVDAEGKAIAGYEDVVLPAFEDTLVMNDLEAAPIEVEGYDYWKAIVTDKYNDGGKEVGKIVKETVENEEGTEVAVYNFYDPWGNKADLPEENPELTLYYVESAPVITVEYVDQNGDAIEEESEFPEINGEYWFTNNAGQPQTPVEIEGYRFTHAEIDGNEIRAFEKQVADKVKVSYYYQNTDYEKIQVKEDTLVTFVYVTSELKPGNSADFRSILGSAVNYGIVAWELATGSHMDTNFATAVMGNVGQTTAGAYTGSHNPGDFIIADYTGSGWFTNCSDATRPFIIYTTEDAKAKFSNNIYTNKMLYIDTSNSKEQLTSQVAALINGVDSSLMGQSGYSPAEAFVYTTAQKYELDLTSSPAGTYYIHFDEGDYSNYCGSAGKSVIKMNSDQTVVFNIPDSSLNLHGFTISLDGGDEVSSATSDQGADIYAKRVVFNMPNASSVNAADGVLGVFLCPNADFHIGTTSTGWLVAGKVTNGGEWHGVWQEMPDSIYIPTSKGLKAVKTVDGQTPASGEVFTFTLEEYQNNTWSTIQSKTNNGSEVSFDEISYNAEGTYYYRVSETKGTGEYQYDETTYVVKVVVTSSSATNDNLTTTAYSVDSVTYYVGDGIEDAVEANQKASAAFDNKKVVKGAISVTKAVVNAQPADSFYFVLKDANGTPVVRDDKSVFEIKAGATVTVNDLELGAYTLTETDANGNVVAENTEGFPYTVTYTNDNITLTAESKVQSATITNTYDAEGSYKFEASKAMTGRTMKDGEFTFTVTEVDGDFTASGTNKAGANSAITFDKEESYTLADIGEHTYIIAETEGKATGVTYDNAKYEVVVEVKDNGDGTLSAAWKSMTKVAADGTRTPITAENATAAFTNKFTATDSLKLEAVKTVNGKTPSADEVFYFTLTGEGVNQEKKNDGGKIVFDEISYDQDDAGKTFTYTVKEIKKDVLKGYTYSTVAYTVEVTVSVDEETEALKVDKVYKIGGQKYTGDLAFDNTYPEEGEAVIKATKKLEGGTLSNIFTFELYASDEKGSFAAGASPVATATNNGAEVSFSLSYDKEDVGETYYYTIVEKEGTLPGYTYADNKEVVAVTVSEKDGKVVADVSYASDGGAIFVNTYDVSGEAVLEATKSIAGREMTDADVFKFVVYEVKTVDGKEVESKVAEATNVGETITFPAIGYQYNAQVDDRGEHTYIIKEVAENGSGLSADTREFKAVVLVEEDAATGTLKTTVTYPDGAAAFVNTYAAEGEITLTGTKTMTGREMEKNEFTFVVTDEDGKEVATGTNVNALNAYTADIEFTAISYTEPGTYTYTITEENGGKAGVAYDTAEITVVVEVTDNGDGTLKAEVVSDSSDAIAFTNEYTATGEVTFEAEKTVKGQVPTEDEVFSFTLTGPEYPEGITVQNSGKSITFPTITYDQTDIGKEYTYTITEDDITDPALNGYTKDSAVYTVVVSIKDADKDGELEVTKTIKKDGSEGISVINFNNTYPVDGEVVLVASKSLTGGRTLEADQFKFELHGTDRTHDGLIETVTNAADGSITFSPLTYDKSDVGKTYTYTIYEVKENKPGYTYDEDNSRTVTVKVTEEGGAVVATATYEDGKAEFVNTYEAAGTLPLEGTKKMDGRELTETDKFLFLVTEEVGEETKVVSTGTNNANGEITFKEISYALSDVGTHIYTVYESKTEEGGVVSDTAKYTLTVIVTDNGEGKLEAEITSVQKNGEAAGTIEFVNTYKAETSIVLEAGKILTGGRDLKAGEFNFVVTDANGKEVATGTNDADGKVTFTEITYTQADKGTHTYKVTEKAGADKNITYSAASFDVTVTVTDNGDGTMTATADKKADAMVFENAYSSEGKVQFQAEKTVNGEVPAETFEFILTGPGVNETVVNNGSAINFSEITYTQEDVAQYQKNNNYFTYTIKELAGDKLGYTYDSTEYKAVVALSDDGNGKITATTTYYKGTTSIGATLPAFENKYPTPGKIALEATKSLTGRDLASGMFTFDLVAVDNAPMPTENYDNVPNDGTGKVAFGEIEYTREDIGKTYTYHIVENDTNMSGYIYDDEVEVVTVTVAQDENGELVITADYDDVDKTEGAVFENTYGASASFTLEGTKELNGRKMEAGEFKFIVTDVFNGKTIEVTNNADGTISFPTFDYVVNAEKSDVGTHTYKITEVKGDKAEITYDETEFTVVVEVADPGTGELTVTPSYPTTGVVFKNTYAADGSIVLEATKSLTGRTMAEGEFSFVVTDAEGNEVATGVNGENGIVTFSELNYTLADVGTHTYTVSEVKGDALGVTYTDETFEVIVTVADKGDGTLSVTADKTAADMKFENTYAANGSAQFKANKTVNGAAPAGDVDFSFVLTGPNVAGGSETVTTNGAAVNFTAINFTQEDVAKYNADNNYFTYTMAEVKGSEAGYTYDETVYTVKVALADNGKGEITATFDYYQGETKLDGAPTFKNSFPTPGAVQFTATKKLVGHALADGDFSFDLALVENAGTESETVVKVMESDVKNVGETVTFAEIAYDRNDIGKTYTYKITENNSGKAGYTYDEHAEYVTVSVSQAEDGSLVITKAYDADGAVFTNHYNADTSIELTAKKFLSGRELKANEFQFTLKEAGKDGIVDTALNAADGTVTFKPIFYTQEDAGKTFTYEVAEVKGSLAGVTYDEAVYTVKVTVTDNNDGTMKAEITEVTGKGGNSVATDSKPVFRNTYVATGDITLTGSKKLTGRDMAEGEFTFTVKEGDAVVATGKNAKASKDAETQILFEKIAYTLDDVGTHTYTVTEDKGSIAGITYDETVYTVVVEVTDNGDATLKAEIVSVNGEEDGKVAFVNAYGAEGKAVLNAVKLVNGKELTADSKENGKFYFKAEGPNGYNEEVVNDGSKVTFPEISYTQDDIGKTYTYTITERVKDKLKGYTYDDTKYTAVVSITDADADGKLEVEVKYVGADGGNVTSAVFNNTYPEPGKIVLTAAKDLQGGTLSDGDFTFELYLGDELIDRVTNKGTTVTFKEIEYTEADVDETYVYTIKEVNDGKAGYTYDKDLDREVTVKVTENFLTKKLNIDVEYEKVGEDEGAVFHNIYNAAGSLKLEGTKMLEGRELTEADVFKFAVLENGTIVSNGTSDATGKVTFEEIKYTEKEIGTHVYTIKEVAGDDDSITYSNESYELTVVVSDNGDGTLKVDYKLPETGFTFTNKYDATGKITLEGTKVLTGRELTEADVFNFEVFEVGVTEAVATGTSDVTGKITFTDIEYTLAEVGTHTYTVKEVKGTDAAITYSEAVLTVVVEVTDLGNGTLEAVVVENDSDVIEFTNAYTSKGELQFKAIKTVNGERPAEGVTFTFELTNDKNSTVLTATSDAIGEALFETIEFTEADVANSPITYTVKEVTTNPMDGYTYDESVYTVVVELSDDGKGNIKVGELVFVKADGTQYTEATFNNIYEAEGAVVLEAEKTLEGAALESGQFTFILTDEEGQEIDRVTNNGSAVTFKEIAYKHTDAGKTYTYFINELIPEDKVAGYTYDETVFEVTVEVTDNGNGTLEIVKTYKDITGEKPVFVNRYDKKEVEISKIDAVSKNELVGAQMVVTDADGNVVDEWLSSGTKHVVKVDYNVEYTLTETAAPNGYLIAAAITFKVDDDGNVLIKQADGSFVTAADSVVVMIDQRKPKDPTPTPEDDEPTPTPGDDEPTPTPSTYTPGPSSSASPTSTPEGEVLGAKRTSDGEVLGARRGSDYAVLGKRRRPATGDSLELLLWIMALATAFGGAVSSTVMLHQNKKRTK